MTQALPLIDNQHALPGRSTRQRAAALAEVLLAFALVHACWRSFKHFTYLGRLESSSRQNYSAGLVMIAFSIGAVRLRGWNLSDFGLNLKNWRYNLNLGIVWGILSPIALLFALLLTGGYRLRVSHPGEAPWNLALLASCMAIASSLLLLLMLSRRRAALAATPPTASIPALLVLWSLPALAALLFHRPFGHMVGVLGWMIVGAGLGEEIFFRGYVQTRLDLAFGRPVAFAGVRFGMGLIVSSMLFGLVHALNTVDYFHGQFHFNWPLGFVECFEGAVFAIMREETGSVFPGAIAHGLGDVLTRIPG